MIACWADSDYVKHYHPINPMIRMLKLALACALLSTLTAFSQTNYQWTNLVAGTANGSWSTAANWTPAGPAAGTDNTAQFTQPITGTATLTLDGSNTIGNLYFGNTATNAIGWTINAGSPSTSTLTLNVSAGTPAITVTNQTATLGAVVAGSQGFTLTGPGTLSLSAANTVSGPVTVNSGDLTLNNLNALPGGDSLTIANGALVQPKAAGTFANLPTTLNGNCNAYGSFGGSLDFHSGGATTATWPGSINLNAANATIGCYGVTYIVNLSGQLTGSGSLTFRPEGGSATGHTAMFTLSNPSNNYAGNTTMQVGTAELSATLKLGVNNGLPVGTALSLNRVGSSGTVFFDLAGYNQTLAGLTANYASNAVINSSGTAATLTVSNLATTTFNGLFGVAGNGGISLSKQGTGTLTLNNTNLVFTGTTTIGGGTLALNGLITATRGLILGSNGTLQLALGLPGTPTNIVVNGDVSLAGQINVSDYGIVSNTAYPAIYYTGNFTNNGLTLAPNSPWAITIDTNTPHLIQLIPTQQYPYAQFTNGSFAVTTLTTNLGGILSSPPAGPIWYEVRDQTNRMWDFGATKAVSPWSITVRHLRAGTNTVTMFAQTPAGVIQSNSIQLTLSLAGYPAVRPRPVPSEIWWGGLATNSQMTNFSQWPFVQRYEDGYFFHTAGWSPGTLMQQLAANLSQFNTKYWPELGGNCPSPTTNWYQGQTNAWGGWALASEANGIIFSEFTHDYHIENMKPVCQANPTWLTNDDIVWWTGDLTKASTNYPYTSGIWRDVFNSYYLMLPHVKVGHTSSPVWFGWTTYPALDGNNLGFTITNSSGQNIAISLTADATISSFVNMAAAINHPYFSQQSDCPWDYFGFNGTLSTGAQNRQKIRTYEQYLQSRSCRHTLICNVGNASSAKQGSETAANLYYENSSLSSMYLHQKEGGRANRYLYESWYWGIPYAVVPETTSGTYTHLALSAIKYLKGIQDTNGTLEQLNINPTATNGTVLQLQLQNNGDVQCLPALAGQPGTVPGVTTRYFTTNGAEITATVLTAEGFCYTNMLQPGATTNLFAVTLASGLASATNENASLEAFWNPQDPLGLVRDRQLFPAPLTPPGRWQDADIGSVGVTGGAAITGTNFTLLGSGADIWSTADACHFLWQTNSGDGTLTARVTSQTAADASSKAGVMIRESTAAGARNVFVCVTPNSGLSLQTRLVTNGSSYNTVVAGPVAPYWVRLTRSGTNFTAYYSANGSTWTTVGSSNVAGFATSALWGLAATAHNTALGNAATFDNVSLPNAAPVLTAITNRTVTAGQTLTVTNSATDANSPPQTLTYSLVSAPTNAAFNPASGLFSWRPGMAQSPSTNLISVSVTDNGTPPLAATQNFSVFVLRPAAPTISLPVLGSGGFSLTVTGTNGPDYALLVSTNLFNWQLLQQTSSPALPVRFVDPAATNAGASQRFYRIQLLP